MLNSLPMAHLFLLLLRIKLKVLILKNDLKSISTRVYNWKMLFDPDSSKPAQEVLLSRKKENQVHPTINLNKVQVERVSYQKHLGVLLDEKLNFKQHVDSAISKVNKVISVIKRFRHNLPKKSLVTICKAFLRPLIDYDDIVNDHPQSESFCEKIESV